MRAVPISPCPASTACPGVTSMVPLVRLVSSTVPATRAVMPWSVPDAISGTGLAAAASTISRPLEKFRLAHENSPLCSRAYSPAVSFSSETNSPAERACWRRMTSARARWPGVRVVKSVAQTAPCSQSNRGRNKNSPAQSPRRRSRGHSRKNSPSLF